MKTSAVIFVVASVLLCADTIYADRDCGPNTWFTRCGEECEPSCIEPAPVCNQICVPDVCQCISGFLRDFDGRCVLPRDCRSLRKIDETIFGSV